MDAEQIIEQIIERIELIQTLVSRNKGYYCFAVSINFRPIIEQLDEILWALSEAKDNTSLPIETRLKVNSLYNEVLSIRTSPPIV